MCIDSACVCGEKCPSRSNHQKNCPDLACKSKASRVLWIVGTKDNPLDSIERSELVSGKFSRNVRGGAVRMRAVQYQSVKFVRFADGEVRVEKSTE